MSGPSGKQLDVLKATENLVVVGRPGSGKTSVALWKARKELEGRQPAAQDVEVLFLSFSRAAIERIEQSSRAEVPRALRGGLRLATYHSLCYEVLSAHCTLIGLRKPLRVLETHQERAIERSEGGAAEQEFLRLERAESLVRLDRFAPLACDILRKYPALRAAYGRAYPLILVDEYQDTDDHQDEFVRLLANQGQLICLGDPDQRIYEWRPGVRPDRMERLVQERGFRPIDLGDGNYRNAGTGLREGARSILEGTPRLNRAVTVWRSAPKLEQVVTKICDAVSALRAEAARDGWSQPGGPTICVMMPTNKLVQDVSRYLRQLPAGDARRFRHEIVVDWDKLEVAWMIALEALEHAGNPGTGGTLAILESIRADWRTREGESSRTVDMRVAAWCDGIKDGRTPKAAFLQALEKELAAIRLVQGGDPVQDVGMVVESFGRLPGNYVKSTVRLLQLRPPGVAEVRLREGLRRAYAECGYYKGAGALGRQQLLGERLLSAGERRARLVLMTLHRCKGREFDAVVLAEPTGPRGRFLRADDLSGSRRLLHVAITRARRKAIIITPFTDPTPLVGALPSVRPAKKASRGH